MKDHRNGFTLLEIVLYMGIGAILLGTITAFLFSLQAVATKTETMLEVEESGRVALALLLQAARDANGVNSFSRGTTADHVSLRLADAARNPTVIDVSSGALRLREGTGPIIPITPLRVSVANFIVRNVAPPGTLPVLRFELDLQAVNGSGRNEFEYRRTFFGTAVLRP